MHDSDPATVSGFVSRVEQTYNTIFRFCELNKIEAHRPTRRLEVVFYDKRAEFDEYARSIRFPAQGAYGVYYEPGNRSTFFNVSSDPDFLQIHADLAAARAAVGEIRVEEPILTYLVSLARATRESPSLSLGVSPRGAAMLLHASKAWAWLVGRDYLTPDEVKAMAKPALRHRVQLRPEVELEGVTADAVLDGILATVPVPR